MLTRRKRAASRCGSAAGKERIVGRSGGVERASIAGEETSDPTGEIESGGEKVDLSNAAAAACPATADDGTIAG